MATRESVQQPRVGSEILEGLSAFAAGSLRDPALAGLESELTTVRLRGGETLFSAGDPGDALYVVVYGRLRAVLPDRPRGAQWLGEIGRGESVGEMAILTGAPRSATVSAIRDTQLVRLSKAGFERMAERQPKLMLEMARLIIARYQRVIKPSEKLQAATIAVVPCQDGLPFAAMAESLRAALTPGRRTLLLDPMSVQQERGAPADRLVQDLDGPDLAGWLQEQELRHDYLIYVADPSQPAWTALCTRQADLVLLVGASGAPPDRLLPAVEALGTGDRGTGARRELVLLYDSGRRLPTHTADWLARVPVGAHHHVDPTRPKDFARLARLLTGRATGLVLGGGGARGLAHIGVIRAMEEADIPIDLVGGTSVGAIMGGQLASGWDSARILAESRRALVENGSLNDFTVPVFALLRGTRYVRMLERIFGDRRIEDLPRTFYCVSANLTRSTMVVHRSRLLHRCVAASCAVPGLGPPIVDGHDLLVDGGVVNNLPVDIMRGSGANHVIASSVSPHTEIGLPPGYPAFPSPWRVLLNWANPFASHLQVPSIMNILTRSASLQQPEADQHADLIIEPSSREWRLLDWKEIDRIVDGGYRAAVPALERWQREQTRPES